jgi:hypothetical protein
MWIERFSATVRGFEHAALGVVSHVLYRKPGGTKCRLGVGVTSFFFFFSVTWTGSKNGKTKN